MLATVRIGAIHSVVFAGFGAKALGDRMQASGSRSVFTADVTYRKGKDTRLKEIVDEALQNAGDKVEHVVLLKRTSGETPMRPGRDILWEQFLEHGAGESGDYVQMEANEPAFILATSGTTATPKLAVHTHGGYQVHIHSMGQWLFGLKPTDVWWSDLRHRLDRRSQLHCVRAADRGCDDGRLRRRARLSDPGGDVEDVDGGVSRHRHFHVTHRGAAADARTAMGRSEASITNIWSGCSVRAKF